MGIFKSTRLFYNASVYTDSVANSITSSLKYDGYEVNSIKMPSGDWDISIKKGDLLKAVLGLQTALKIVISPTPPHVYVKAGVGIFGQQAIPTILTVCVWWPFAIPQIWGIIKQSNMDKMVLDKIQSEFNRISGKSILTKDI